MLRIPSGLLGTVLDCFGPPKRDKKFEKELEDIEKERQKEQAANDAAEAIRVDEEQKAEGAKPKKKKKRNVNIFSK